MQDAYLARYPGCSMVRSGDGLRLVARETGRGLSLNRTAALTWMLCDGTRTCHDIVESVRDLYPAAELDVSTETRTLLDRLLAEGWIRPRAIAAERPVLRVAFRGFWQPFDPGDQYLVWMLSFRYDVLVVEESSIPDLLFFRSGTGAHDWDRDRTLGVLCAAAGEDLEPVGDLTIVWDGPDAERQLGLPSWALLMDWRRSHSAHPGAAHLAHYSPSRFGERFVAALERQTRRESQPQDISSAPEVMTRPTPTLQQPCPRLTVGMATYDDYDGVYFTVQALMLYHPELAADLEILIVDNHPEGPDATALRGLEAALKDVRYLPFTELRSTAVRDLVFRHAQAPIVLCVDPHVLLPPGTLIRLVEYLEARPDCLDLLQGPLLYDDHKTLSTHFDPIWSDGMFGVWATDKRGLESDGAPFEIPMQGLGLFACRRHAWPGLNPRFRGFGGEEGYLHEKFRRQGARVLCLPFLRWLHRFQRPRGLKYENTWEDRIRNYLIGHHELAQPTAGLESHFRSFLSDEIYESAEAATDLEMASPIWGFDAIYGVGLDREDDRHHFESVGEKFGLHRLLRWRTPLPASIPAPLRLAAEHRRILKRAAILGFRSLLLIDGSQSLSSRAVEALRSAVAAHEGQEWRVSIVTLAGEERPWAVAYHQRIYQQICNDLPAAPEAMAEQLEARGGTFWSYLESLTSSESENGLP